MAAARLLTAAAVAERWAVSVKTVYRLAETGQLPCVRISNRCIRFDEAELEAWIDERKAS